MAHTLQLMAPSQAFAVEARPPQHGRLVPLDGLRGIAVLMVMLFHWRYLPVGWSGVWLFFNLSGFFIFRNLLSIKSARPRMPFSTYYREFMYRRCMRLFPLYYLLLAIMMVTVIIIQRWDLLTYTLPSLALFIHNLVKPFSTIKHTLYYDHFWSLGVELHFYLIAPFLIYYLSRPALRRVLIGVIVVTPLLREAGHAILAADPSLVQNKPGGLIYMASYFHFDAFALGGLVAMHERFLLSIGRKAWWLLVLPGIMFVGFAAFVALMHRDMPFQLFMFDHFQASLGYSLLIACCSGLICVALVDKGLLHRMLTFPLLLLLGRISYGVYLMHGALLMLTIQLWDAYFPGQSRYSPVILALFVVYFFVTVGLAWISFTYFESRFLPKAPSTTPSRIRT